jgi:hypothetical protein
MEGTVTFQIIETDNFGGDYPDEKVVASGFPDRAMADAACKAVNDHYIKVVAGMDGPRFYKVEDSNYELQPGFQP